MDTCVHIHYSAVVVTTDSLNNNKPMFIINFQFKNNFQKYSAVSWPWRRRFLPTSGNKNGNLLVNPFAKHQILDSSKLKQFADYNFNFFENGTEVSKQVENTVGKGEIACHEQFLLFSQCFEKNLHCRHVKTRACMGKG